MPRLGQEPLRREALTAAAIAGLHEHGLERLTVADIARRAGVSSALAHHYFGAKDDLLLAAMRRLLAELSGAVVARLRAAEGPRARLSAILLGSFAPEQFRVETVSAWLAFYALAGRDTRAARLFAVYRHRLDSNLRHVLRPLVGEAAAPATAEAIAALIDGLWLRHALVGRSIGGGAFDPAATLRLAEGAAEALIKGTADA